MAYQARSHDRRCMHRMGVTPHTVMHFISAPVPFLLNVASAADISLCMVRSSMNRRTGTTVSCRST
jgi:hypothetical protein